MDEVRGAAPTPLGGAGLTAARRGVTRAPIASALSTAPPDVTAYRLPAPTHTLTAGHETPCSSAVLGCAMPAGIETTCWSGCHRPATSPATPGTVRDLR